MFLLRELFTNNNNNTVSYLLRVPEKADYWVRKYGDGVALLRPPDLLTFSSAEGWSIRRSEFKNR